MKVIKLKKFFATIALVGGAALGGVAKAGEMQTFTPLPVPNCGYGPTNNCITYGDFNVFSLPLLYVQQTYATSGTIPTTNPGPGDPYYVASSPGELGKAGYIVYGTGTNNNNVVTNGDGTLIDNAQQQPNGNTPSSFVVGSSSETSPTFSGDSSDSWDAMLSAVRAELANGSDPNGQFVIYFNLNETGTDSLEGIDLLAWFKVTLVDLDGGLEAKTFYLTGSPGSTSAPVINDPTDPNWVYVHGKICVSSTAGFLGFGPCTPEQKAAGGKDINQNLGANQAAFAIYNEELSSLVLDSGYDIMRGNWQFSYLNNGYEQQFSALTPFNNQIPEPGTLALLGTGLMGLGLGSLLRRKVS